MKILFKKKIVGLVNSVRNPLKKHKCSSNKKKGNMKRGRYPNRYFIFRQDELTQYPTYGSTRVQRTLLPF